MAIMAKTKFSKNFPNLSFRPFRKEKVILIASLNHPLGNKEIIRIEDLQNEKLIMKEEGSATRELVYECFRKNGVEPISTLELGNIDTIYDLVAQGEGIAFLIELGLTGRRKPSRVKALQVANGRLFLDTYISYRNDKSISPVANLFLKMLENISSMPF
jgi:DNA-binding transcriptional LysR family regulator